VQSAAPVETSASSAPTPAPAPDAAALAAPLKPEDTRAAAQESAPTRQPREPTVSEGLPAQTTGAPRAPIAARTQLPAPVIAAQREAPKQTSKPESTLSPKSAPAADAKPETASRSAPPQPSNPSETPAPAEESAQPSDAQRSSAAVSAAPDEAARNVARAQPESTPVPSKSEPSAAPEATRSNRVPAHLASLPAQSAEEIDSEERGRLTGQDIGLNYPRRAKRLAMKGTLFVRLIVADDGGVLDVEIVEADPPNLKAVYEDAIEKAMMKLRYPPRKENWPIEYDLEVDPPTDN
jgi:outer membrane biosynthesis protein TonB